MRKRTILLALVMVILILAGLYLLLVAIGLQLPQPPPTNVTPIFDYKLQELGVLSYKESKIVYLTGSTQGSDIKSLSVNASLFTDDIPSDIYLLDYAGPGFSGCVECSSMDEFKYALENELKKYSLIPAKSKLNLIKPHQLETLTNKAVIIVATGKIPSFLVGLESGTDLNYLLGKGFVVIYVGSEFVNSLNRDGTFSLIPLQNLSKYNIGFFTAKVSCDDGFRLAQPNFLLQSQNGSTIHKCMSKFRSGGTGYFMVLPNSLDIGWGYNGTVAGEDLARLIYEVGWQDALTTGGIKINADVTNSIKNNISTVFLEPSPYESGWARIFVQAMALNDSITYKPFSRLIKNPVRGSLSHPPSATNGDVITVTASIKEDFVIPKQVNLSLVAYKDLRKVSSQHFAEIKIGNVPYSTSALYQINLPEGDAILKLMDKNDYVYAQSFLHVPEVTIDILSSPTDAATWESGTFKFQVLSDNSPVPSRDVVITINDSPRIDILPPTVLRTDSAGRFTYQIQKILPFGNYTFKINVTGKSIQMDVSRIKSRTFFDNPLNQAIIIISLLIFGVGMALRRPEKPIYSIDIPDFAPAEKIIVPISKFSLLGLFDSVNRDYKWHFMPLNLQELKKEIRKNLNYQGAPIIITDYNLEKLLDQLAESKEVTKAINLYGLKAWEAQSRRSTNYLALFRLLRTFFTNNAISFTDLNQREDCDIMAIIKGENNYIHIYQNEDSIIRALSLVTQGRNYIAFESEEALEKFQRKIELSSTELATLLRLEMSSGRIILTSPEKFEIMFGKFT